MIKSNNMLKMPLFILEDSSISELEIIENFYKSNRLFLLIFIFLFMFKKYNRWVYTGRVFREIDE